MLVRIMPEQIAKMWEYIQFALKEAAPREYLGKDEIYGDILQALLVGSMQSWFVVREIKDDYELLACVITKLNTDNATRVKSLTIFAVYGYGDLDSDIWTKSYETLTKFAIMNKCQFMDAYTDEVGIVEIGKKFGWLNRHYIYVRLPHD